MKRRDLFKFAGLLAAGQLSGFKTLTFDEAFAAPQGPVETFYCGFREGDPFDHVNSGLVIHNAEGFKRHNLKNEIHSVIYSHKHDMKIFMTKLELLSYYQIGSGDIRPFSPGKGNYFYGHGVVDPTRDVLYTTQAGITKDRGEEARRDEEGYIYVYSLPEMKYIERFKTFGFDPHDMTIMGNNELIVCNGGSNSNVAFIDLTTRKLIKKHTMNYDYISLRHIAVIDQDNFAIAPLSRDFNNPCKLFLLNREAGLIAWNGAEELQSLLMTHQLLSIAVYRGHIITTCPATGRVGVWTTGGQFVGAHQIKGASSIVSSFKHGGVLIGSGDDKTPLSLMTIDKGIVNVKQLDWGKGASGAHAFIL